MVKHHAPTHKTAIDVQLEYSGGSVPLMARLSTLLRDTGEGAIGLQVTPEERSRCRTTEAGESIITKRSLTTSLSTSSSSTREVACR